MAARPELVEGYLFGRICFDRLSMSGSEAGSALARFEPAIRFIDHIGASTATNHAAVPMAVFERLQRVADFHNIPRPYAGLKNVIY